MVHAPGFFTLAAQLVRRLWSKSVAVIVNLSSLASNKKFERIGIVVFRSTTLCAAVNSRSSSARETVISRLPVGAATAVVSVIWGSWVALVTVVSPENQFVCRWPNCTPNPTLRAHRKRHRLLDSRVEPTLSATDFFVEPSFTSVRPVQRLVLYINAANCF